MVSVGEGVVNNVPCLFEGEHLLIDQNSQQLNGTNCWMGVIKLDLVLVCEHGKSVVVSDLISPDDIINGG